MMMSDTMTDAPKIVALRKLTGRVEAILTTSAKGRLGFQSETTDELVLDLEGITGNRHRGWTRKADGRVPYLPRGTVIRNERQLSIVSVEDLAEIARRLGISDLDPRWLGANIVVSGMPHFSYLPRGTHLFFASKAVVIITDQNAPCTLSGDAIARQIPDRPDIQMGFAKHAHGLRGVTATVEHPGAVITNTTFDARLPAQWIY
jgi:hypothetical protein